MVMMERLSEKFSDGLFLYMGYFHALADINGEKLVL